jgi:hypothetical protein
MKTEWAIYRRRRAKIYADIADDHAERARGIQSELIGPRPAASTLRSADRGYADFLEFHTSSTTSLDQC